MIFILIEKNMKIDKKRQKQTAEHFTPDPLVNEILDKLEHYDPDCFKKADKKWLDPSCGRGAFLIGVRERLRKYHPEEWINENMIYGVDLMRDNCEYCKSLGFKNIVCADGLKYDYSFKVEDLI
jgi:type I restriction-modification system DNA methylase subunit